MVNFKCPNCEFQTGDYPATVCSSILDAHNGHAHGNPQAATRKRAPKVDRPELADDIEEEEWNNFHQNWRIFVQANGIDEADIAVQLYSCCNSSLKPKLFAIHHDFLDRPVVELLPLLKKLTVIPVSRTVKTNELLQLRQDAGESIRTFHSRVKAKALTCYFKKKCEHQHAAPNDGGQAPEVFVDYTSEMIHHVIMNGLYDQEIKRDISGNEQIDMMDVKDLIALIERKETARDSANSSNNNAISQYRKQQRPLPNEKENQSSSSNDNVQKKGNCPTCGNSYFLFRIMRGGQYNKKPFGTCKKCWKPPSTRENSELSLEQSAITFEISSTTVSETPNSEPASNHTVPALS